MVECSKGLQTYRTNNKGKNKEIHRKYTFETGTGI
jgi:hypothetical protein